MHHRGFSHRTQRLARVGRKQLSCAVLRGELQSDAFEDHLSTLWVALRHPVGFLVTFLTSSKSLTSCIYLTLRKRDVAMEIEMLCPDFFPRRHCSCALGLACGLIFLTACTWWWEVTFGSNNTENRAGCPGSYLIHVLSNRQCCLSCNFLAFF